MEFNEGTSHKWLSTLGLTSSWYQIELSLAALVKRLFNVMGEEAEYYTLIYVDDFFRRVLYVKQFLPTFNPFGKYICKISTNKYDN